MSEATGLHSAHGTARAKVTDRPGWAAANVRSIERLVGPALLELQRKRGAKLGGPVARRWAARVAGTQLGLMLAYMATRVLGQYDLLINDEVARGPGPRLLRRARTSSRSRSSTASRRASSACGSRCTR